jgi:hypothetical protein
MLMRRGYCAREEQTQPSQSEQILEAALRKRLDDCFTSTLTFVFNTGNKSHRVQSEKKGAPGPFLHNGLS